MNGLIISESELSRFQLRLDGCNVLRPVPVQSGADAGKYFIDADVTKREPRWQPLLSNARSKAGANSVAEREIAKAELQP